MGNTRMTLGIMQPYFIPYIGYFQLINAVDKFILYGNLPFQKRTWISRNRIMIKGQSEQFILVPLIGKTNSAWISETEINPSTAWKVKMLRTLWQNYKGSLFFDEVYAMLQPFLLTDCQYLHDYNATIIKGICSALQLKAVIVDENARYLPIESRLREEHTEVPDVSDVQRKTQRIFLVCRHEHAQSYINLPGGANLYSKEIFKKNSISLSFIRRKEFSYGQFSKTFVPDLSIIDVLMHKGLKGTRELLENYELF